MTLPYRRLLRLALPLATAALMAGCVTTNPTNTVAPSSANPPEGRPAPRDTIKLEGCDRIKQLRRAEAVSDDRLLDTELACLTAGPGISPARLNGATTVINLWATWCEPCRQEMPMLQAVHRRFGNQLQFLGVNTKDRSDWAAEFLEKAAVSYPQVVDPDGQLLASLRSPGLPVTVVVDTDGRVIGKHVGRISEKQLTDLLPTGSAPKPTQR